MYVSTRSDIKVHASKAILKGLAEDGGLFFPCMIKKAKIDEKWLDYTYKDLAKAIFKYFLDDYTKKDIDEIVEKAYNTNNFPEKEVGLDYFDNFAFLTLFHGPTLAFKDMALTALPLLFKKAAEKQKIKEEIVILTATSGDTGSAALSGFSKAQMDVICFYPNDGVSEFQEKQMHSFKNANNKVLAVEGSFDDCQKIVKKALNDAKKENTIFSSANSINIGRLIPQIVYYFYGYFEAVRKKKIVFNEKINICVPTGNFGDILAGYIAKQMGLPIEKLLCASNENKVLTDFFNSGIYDRNRQLLKTISPSMDILVSSNLERLLYMASGCDFKYIKKLMQDLQEKGSYEINSQVKENLKDFYGNYMTTSETENIIKEVYEKYNYLIDTHTAVSYGVYKKYLKENDDLFTLVLSTASPYKFSKAIGKALGIEEDSDFKRIDKIEEITSFKKDPRIDLLRNIVLEKDVVRVEDAMKRIINNEEG